MDTIADMLTGLLNAQRVGKKRVIVPYSHFKEDLAKLLQQKKMVAKVRTEAGSLPTLVITLAYDAERPRLHGMKRLSTPGRRWYVGQQDIPYITRGSGMIVVSTSQGLMDSKAARKAKMGGELICEIW